MKNKKNISIIIIDTILIIIICVASFLLIRANTGLRKGLVGYWKFDEGVGDKVNDSSGNRLTGNWKGNGSHWTDGLAGKAGNFNGEGDYVSIPYNSSLHTPNQTISVWFRLNSINPNTNIGTVLLSDYFPNNDRIFYVLSDGSICIRVSPPPRSTCSKASAIRVNKWYLASAVIKDNSIEILYVDGYKIAEGKHTNTSGSGHITAIGGASDVPGSNSIDGLMDEVRIYNRVLSEAEIQDIFKQQNRH